MSFIVFFNLFSAVVLQFKKGLPKSIGRKGRVIPGVVQGWETVMNFPNFSICSNAILLKFRQNLNRHIPALSCNFRRSNFRRRLPKQ